MQYVNNVGQPTAMRGLDGQIHPRSSTMNYQAAPSPPQPFIPADITGDGLTPTWMPTMHNTTKEKKRRDPDPHAVPGLSITAPVCVISSSHFITQEDLTFIFETFLEPLDAKVS